MAATIKIIDVTSSTAQARQAEMTEIKIRNLLAVRFLIRSIKLTIQAKKPASFKSPTSTIMPTRNNITSKEENFMTLSISIVCVIKRTDVPRNANVKRKLQNKSVPNIDTENIEMDIA
jgi:hypothetical protein